MAGEKELDDLLAVAAKVRMAPSDALMARVLADAEAVQPPAPVALPPRRAPERSSLWTRLVEALRGHGTAAGLGTAVVAGLAIGLAQPNAITVVSGGYLTLDVAADEALFPDMTLFLTEDQG